MNICVMDSPELKELYNSVKETGESYESIKNLVNVWQLRKFNQNKDFDFTELPTKQDIENLLKERDIPNIDSTFMQEYTQEMRDILAKAPRDSQGRLLASNGKPSNLTERQYAQVRTKAFKEWFGDWENEFRNSTAVNRVFENTGLGLGKNNPNRFETKEDSIYRITGRSQIDDIIESGYVRPPKGKLRGGKQGEVHWARGDNKLFYTDTERYILETKKDINNKVGALSIDDLTAIWKFDGTKWVNIISDIKASVNSTTNSVSKVVDENGEPLVVYHGSKNKNFSIFDYNYLRKADSGFFFSSDKEYAKQFGDVREFFLNIKNPNITNIPLNIDNVEKLLTVDYKEGTDGIQGHDDTNTNENLYHSKKQEYVAFRPNQIKSATDNIGTFSTEDNRIDRFEDTILNENNKLTEEQKQFILNALPNLDTFIEDTYKAVSQEKYKNNPYYQLFLQIIDTLKVNNIPVSIVKDFDIDSIAQIRRTNFKEAIIKVNPKMLFDYLTHFDRDKMKSKTVRVILHELVHSITADIVDSHPSWSKFKGFDEAQSKFNAEIDRLYNIVVKEIGNEEWYGLENKAEFIAEALTDQAFQKRLSDLKYNKKQTIFERIANSIRDLFYRLFYKHGIDISNSVFEDILKVSQEYLDYAKFGINKNINTYGWGNTINRFEQIKNTTQKQVLDKSVEDVISKLKSLNHKLGSLGSNKNIEKYLKNANIPLEFRNIIIEGLNAIPSIKNLTPYTALQYLINVQNKGLIEQFNESIKKPQNEELEKLLFNYLKKYNIEINIGEAVKQFGDVTGVYDIINKIIYIANNRNQLTVPEEFGHAFVELMGSTVSRKEENKDFTFLMNTVENTDFYKTVYEKYKNVYLRNGEPDIYKIKKEAIGQAIGLSLITQYNNKSAKISDRDKTFFQKIREFINHILDKFKNVEYLSFNTLIDQIAKEILENNHSRLQKIDTKNYNLLDYYKTIEEQNKQDGGKALEFMQFFSQEMGNIITGSLAYRLQGATYRPKLDSLHDIDMMVPLSAHGIGLDSSAVRQAVKLAKQRNQEKLFELITNSDYFLKIKNKYPKIRFGAAYPGRGLALTVNAVYSEDTTLSERFLKMSGSYADRLSNFTEEERKQIYLFDFFLKENEIDSFLEPTYKLSLANFDIPIREKRYMGRAKDIIDYQMWKVFDEYKNKILPQEEDIMYQLNSINIKQESKQWNRYSDNNYEVSSEGDKRFSAKYATFKPNTIIDGVDVGGKTIEYVYQNVIKKSGKGQTPSKDSRLYIPSVSSYTGNITPDANTIFVFGSNPEGRHGAGAAKIAREQFGAIYGQGEGLQGNAYALPTKRIKSITPAKTGQMTFSYGTNKRSDVKSNTTLEAIINGERTATTRYSTDGHIDYWKGLKVGDIVAFTSADRKTTVYVKITKSLTQLNSLTNAEEWSKKEGWSIEYYNNKVKPKVEKGQAYQMEYEFVDANGERTITPLQIIENIKKLYETARQNPNKQFKIAYRNTDKASLNGYTGLEMIDMFLKAGSIPSNIVFSKEWVDTGKFNLSDEAKEDFSYTEGYLPLWQEWAKQNPELIEELREKSKGKVLTDKFADTRVSQARALADILNSTNIQQSQPQQTPIPENLKETPETVAQDINKEEQSNYVKRIVRAEIIEQYNEELKDFGSLEKRQDRINLILRFIRNQKGSLFKKHKEYFENRLKDENLTEEERLQYERHLKNLDADDLFISEINNIMSRLKSSFSPESLSRLLSRKILEKTVPNFNELSEEEQNERIENDYNYRVQEYSKIQKHWDSLLEDVKATLRLVDGIIIDYVNPNESDTDNNNEETGSTKDNWMYQARKVDQRESLSKKVKVIISNIPILDNNGRQEYDDLGFARFMDSEEVASTLFYELSNSRSCEHFWKKFNNLPNKKPWTKIIVDTINKENNYEVKSQFYQNFRKESVPYWSQVWTKKGVIKTKKINRGKNTQLLDDWSDNIESGNTLTDNSIYGENGKPNVENASKNRDTLNNLVVDFKKRGNKIGTTNNLNTLVDLIKSVGIEISTDELVRSVNGNVKKTENIFNALLTIFKGVLEGKTILATEVNNLLVYDNIVEKFNKQYNILANTIDFDLKSSELQSFRELGDTYQSVSAPSYVGTLINNLRNTEDEGEFKEFFEKEFGQYSQFVDKQTKRIKNDWLNILYNNKEERENLERKVVLHANRKEFNQQTTEEYLLGMLAEFEATNNNKYAYYALPLLSDADSEEFIKFVRYVDGSVKDESGNPISYKTIINQKLAQIIFDEYERILIVKNRLKNKAETITTFDSKGAEFNYLPELNDITINIDGEIAGKGENRTVFDTITLLISEDKDCIPVITKVIEQIMEKNATEFVQDSLKITSAETIATKLNKDKAAVNKYLTNFFYNHTLATINMIQLLTTDLAYYKNTVDFYKRFKEVYAATLKLDTTAKFKGDDGIIEGTKTQEVMILKDNVIKAPSYDNIKSILDGRVEAGAITSEQRDELLKAYKKVNVADAQGYRTLKSYRKLMVMAGRWNKKLEKSYQRLKNGKFDYEDFSCIYNTIKPFCYSQRPVDSQVSYNNERTGGTVEYGKLKVPIQIKDSEAVLLAMYSTLVSPLNKSERLVGLNKFMDDKDIDIVVFESGVKVGGQGIVDLNNVEDKDVYDKLTEKVFPNGVKNPFIVHSISTEDFGIQVETPDHLIDVEQLIGSQIKKLIQGDIDVNNTGTVTFRINEAIKGREKQMDKKQMLAHLNALLSTDIIDSFEKLRKEFASLDKVAETLQRELKGNSRYTKDLIVACSLVETTDQIGNVIREFGLPLNDATQFSRIENLLTSLFKNNIIKQKMRGGSPIQFSCYGVSDDLHIEMAGEGTERRIKWVDCYLPAYTKEFYKYYLTTDKDGNQFIDINKVPEELKRLIGYRVPTEARYSMLPLRIKGFLPSSEGSKIMLPAEITTIAGSDFDVDKLYVLLPTFYTSYSYNYKKFANEYKHNLMLNKTEEQKYYIIINALNKHKNGIPLDELEQRIVDEFNNTKESYKEPKLEYVRYDYSKSEAENSKEARHNELISCIFSVLTNEDSADKLLTPGGFDIAKKASYICTILNSGKSNIENMFNIKINSYNDAITFYNKLMKMEIDDLKEYNIKLTSGKGVTNPITQIRIHDQNATGGSLIGVYANHNVAHSMFQNIKNQVMSIKGDTKPQLYKEVVFNDKVYKSLTNVKNYEGHLITTNIANFLAASVDNAKDPVLRALMQNNTTANVTCLMLRLGIEPLTIGLFLNQPIIQDMMQAIEEGKSIAESVDELVKTYEQYKDVKTLRNSFKMLDEDLAFNIMYANEEKDNPAFKKYQFWVLNKFIHLYNAGQYLGRYTNINKGDTQNGAAGPSIAEVINKLAQIDNFNWSISSSIGKILEGKFPSAPIVFLPQIGDTSNFIGDATNYGILSIPSLLKDYLPYFSENISKIINSLYEIKENNESAENIEEETRLSDNIVADIFKELTLFTYSRYVKKPLDYYLNDYLNKFIDLKNKYPELSKNLFFKRLKLTQPLLTDGLKLRLLQFSNAGSLRKLQKEQISLSWEMLYRSDNKEISDFVKELFDYFSYVGGFNFNAINPSYLTPISVKLENSNYINALKAIKNLTKEETTKFIYQFVMHHLYNFTVDATQVLNKLTLQTLDNVDFKFNFEKAPKEFLYTPSSMKTRLPANIKVIKGNNIIYYVDTKVESNTQHFVKVEPMGVKGKVFEYNILSNNKTGNLKDIKQSLNFQDMETEITEDVPKEEYSIPDKSDSTELRQQYADNIAFENGASFEDFGGGIDFKEQFEYLKEMNVDGSSFDELGGNTNFTHSNSFNNYEPVNTPDAEGKRTC